MGKKKINIQSILIFLLIVLLTMHSYSQEHFTKELKWELSDSTASLIFLNTNQIIELGKSVSPLATLKSKKFCIRNSNVLILMVDKCSGIYCPSIYVYLVKNKHWQLSASSNARIKDKLEIKVDNKLEKIIFKTISDQIGELPFEALNLNSDKTEQ